MKKEKLIPEGSKELRDRLPRGAIKSLADKYGFSLVWIGKIVAGHGCGDPRIIEDAKQMAKVEDEKRAALHSILRNEDPQDIAV